MPRRRRPRARRDGGRHLQPLARLALAAAMGVAPVAMAACGGDDGPSDSQQTTTETETGNTAPEATPPAPAGTVPTSTTEVTASTVNVTPPDERLEECEGRAADAQVSFSPSLEMAVGEPTEVSVAASVEGGELPPSNSSTTVVSVRMRCEVQAQLRGVDFEVNPAEFQLRSFLDQPTVRWSWDVVPIRAGNRRLTLEIRAIAYIDGRRFESATSELYQASINVDATGESAASRVTGWLVDFFAYPPIATVVGAGLLGGATVLWRRRKKPEETKIG